MPSIKDFEKKKKNKKPKSFQGSGKGELKIETENAESEKSVDLEPSSMDAPPKSNVRRPSREPIMETNFHNSEAPSKESAQFSGDDPRESSINPEELASFSDKKKFELNFPGSFVVKERAPELFNLAEKVAGDWVHDGDFESLPIGHPLAQIVVAKALSRAKQMEKDIVNSAPVGIAKMGFEFLKSKLKGN